jgi:translation initiation factor eIF-2B subunit alpha
MVSLSDNQQWCTYFSKILEENTDTPTAVGAVITLSHVLSTSSETTLQGLLLEVRAVANQLKTYSAERSDLAIISIAASMDVFLLYVTRVATRLAFDFANLRAAIVERAEKFVQLYISSRAKIARVGSQFIRNGSTVLVHGHSKVVLSVLINAAKTCNFTVLVTEGRPVGAGVQVMDTLKDINGISCEVILDSAVAYSMQRVDLCIVGAEGVVESGGVVNMLGTYQLALVAKACKTPLYVATESFKFARLYPLSQNDLPQRFMSFDPDLPQWDLDDLNGHDSDLPQKNDMMGCEAAVCDYTPPEYITLMFTDVGVLTPSAVSDELIKLYT